MTTHVDDDCTGFHDTLTDDTILYRIKTSDVLEYVVEALANIVVEVERIFANERIE